MPQMCNILAAAAAAAVASMSAATAQTSGVTLKVYDNQGLWGPPATEKILTTAAFMLPGDKPFSAELVGSVAFPPQGSVYQFDCQWMNATMGYVWVDGHMVCQDGHTYHPGSGTTDNPLPVNTFKRSKGIVSSLPFRAHFYYNGQGEPAPPPPPSPPPVPPAHCTATSAGAYDDTAHRCGFREAGNDGSYLRTNDWDTAARVCFAAGHKYAGAQASLGQEVWCGNKLPDCPQLPNSTKRAPCPANKTETCGGDYILELITFSCKSDSGVPKSWREDQDRGSAPVPKAPLYGIANARQPPASTVGLSIKWAPKTAARDSVASTLIPTTSLSPNLPAEEAQRDALQRSLSTGWGAWMHSNMLAIVKLPDAATITTMLCQKSTGVCIDSAVPDGAKPHPNNARGTATRVGLHAFDKSYVQFYFGGPTQHLNVAANVSVEFAASGPGNSQLDMLITPISCGGGSANDVRGACDDYEIVLSGRYAWLKAGTLNASGTSSLAFSPPGMPAFTLSTSGSSTASAAAPPAGTYIAAGLGNGPVAFSTATPSVAKITALLAANRAKEEALLAKQFGADRAGEGQAVKASAMWTLVSTPAENGGAPLLPVSRVWSFTPGPINDDFTYAIFDWDNLFATLLAACGSSNASATPPLPGPADTPWNDGFGLAVSNLFQVVKSKTAAGFVPNFAAGGLRSQDRTEPPIGAKVTHDMVKKFGADRMKWVVEVVFNDLLDWNDWFLRKRLKPPLNMVALGTFNDQNQRAGNMQDARYESGLDNSPMYDGTFYNNTNGCSLTEDGCGLMQLYDVGMTSMFVQEAFALADLAKVIGRPQALSDMLTARGQAMAKKISDNLWDDNKGIFVNRFSADHNGGTFYEHVSPTSFYALQALAATDEQAAAMAENWLLNKSHFCIAPNGDFQGLDDSCYWGLPSIEASDPAYPPLGYWRGYIWGPMAQLTFWSLQNYDHVPQVRKARKAMCKQLAALMMSQWNEHRHICENYNPHKTADTSGGDCSGTRFYHWGALTGNIGLMEDGLF